MADRLRIPEVLVDWRTRGFLETGGPVPRADFAAARHSLFDGSFTWPIMVAKRAELEHNVATLARFTRDHGLAFAPHGKTTMSPELFQAQLDAGAWGISAATAGQALVYRELGVPRVLLANEILDAGALRRLAGELDGFEFLCFVDSVEGVRALDEAASGTPFRVLVELGHAGGRTGCRGLAEVLKVADAVRASSGVRLAGVACYEGTQPGADEVRAFLREFREVAHAVAPLVDGRMVLSAGGSAWFDLVAEELASLARPPAEAGLDALVILRSGAYIAHDDGFYRERTPYTRLEGELRPALEVWAQVLSVPEPGLILVGMGKRDVPYDLDMPFPRAVRRGPEGAAVPLDGVTVVKVQDQHAYLTGYGLRPGDLVSFGISHPCTAFDKWRVMPVVDDDYVVIDVISTYF
ncbi:alanine racemase [Planotetraspora sp. A-T 1434]|uniref:alanine racemase n=1 Tax=Planotetraspora sp. A-T 1434 TaxID=2979219 RepID=UPI0021BF3D34|nr:alanine racemase [Planotetraspora sp. A-T 1434]MCT9928957.1 alanine racemase [Planotetraspora sp. A-T 1434]